MTICLLQASYLYIKSRFPYGFDQIGMKSSAATKNTSKFSLDWDEDADYLEHLPIMPVFVRP